MNKNKLVFVSFEPKSLGFSALLSMKDLVQTSDDLEHQLQIVSRLYKRHIMAMRVQISQIKQIRKKGSLTPARKVWDLGDEIFKMVQQLENMSVQIDGLYDHLERDLDVKRKWLEKVIIFRRYLPSKEAVPVDSNWGRFEKGTRKSAEELFKRHTNKV